MSHGDHQVTSWHHCHYDFYDHYDYYDHYGLYYHQVYITMVTVTTMITLISKYDHREATIGSLLARPGSSSSLKTYVR